MADGWTSTARRRRAQPCILCFRPTGCSRSHGPGARRRPRRRGRESADGRRNALRNQSASSTPVRVAEGQQAGAIRPVALGVATGQHAVDQEPADRIAGQIAHVKQAYLGLAGHDRAGIHGQPALDDAVAIEDVDVENQFGEADLGAVLQHEIGPAGGVLRFQLVQLDAQAAIRILRPGRRPPNSKRQAARPPNRVARRIVSSPKAPHPVGRDLGICRRRRQAPATR